MKTAIMLTGMIILISGLNAQPKPSTKPVISIQPALNEVVQDYFRHFQESLGKKESQSEDFAVFESKIKLPGALSCVILKYPSPEAYIWTAVMSEDEDFQVAAKKYKRYFSQINNQKFSPNGIEKYVLSGQFDEADVSRSFASTLLQLGTLQNGLNHFFIDLGIQYEFPNWVVKISMYEKVPDEQMRPHMKSLM